MPFDEPLLQLIRGVSGNWLWDDLAIFFAVYLPIFLGVAAGLAIVLQKRFRDAVRLFAYASLSIILARGIVTSLFYYLLPRPRPFAILGFIPLVNHVTSPAFPSGHAVFFTALAATFFFAGRKKIGLWLFLGAVLVSVARVYAGLHWPSDVLGGMVIGLLSAYGVGLLLKRYAPLPASSLPVR
jgi:undecaprenyl-diphosphatase